MKKRVVNDAESSENLETKLLRAEDRKEELDDEIQQIKIEKEPLEQ